MSMAIDKGDVPAKGSWWRVNSCGCEFVATGEPAGFYNASKVEGPSKCKRETNLSHYIYPPACTLLAPSPSSPGRPVMEAEPGSNGVYPARCLRCGGEKPKSRGFVCEECFPVTNLHQRSAEWEPLAVDWRNGARDFPRSSTQGEPGAGEKVSCVDCAADITERVKAAVVGGGWRCVACNGEFQARTILAKRKAAPTVTSKPAGFKPIGIDWGKDVPVKREVFAGGAWLDYERLSDPDPFTAYKRRRENGVEVAALVETGYGGLTFMEHAADDMETGSAMVDFDRSRVNSKLRLGTWLATDTKPAQSHLYSKPSSPGGSR